MKNLISLSLFLLLSACFSGTPDTPYLWTWISGSDLTNQSANYGTQGVAAGTNIPGAREQSVSWTDSSNNLWLFGGEGYDTGAIIGKLNDLWKFDGTNWTWISGDNAIDQPGVYGTLGSASPTNKPGGRSGAVSWRDASGNLWLFGGHGRDIAGTEGYLNDLWMFNGTNWVWVSGANTVNQAGNYGTKDVTVATNVPGARKGAVSWIDSSGNLWLFGGYDASGYYNDLWKFDGTNWTWISGANTANGKATFGTKGVSAALNVPGSRDGAAAWIDSSDNLWLFGGYGYDEVGNGYLNDVWKFDGTNWTWVSGNNVITQSGSYGTKQVASASNYPGGRWHSRAVHESNGYVWIFGGVGYDSVNTLGDTNELWRFDGSNWTWVKGSKLANQAGTYGVKGVADVANTPGARRGSVIWINSYSEIFLFGGLNINSGNYYFNDLWRFVP